MMFEDKEVYFDRYCPLCEWSKRLETEDPCYDCLTNSVNTSSHKPLYFKEKNNGKS